MGYTQLFEFCTISGCPVVGRVKLSDRASKSTKGPRFGTHHDVVGNGRWLVNESPGCFLCRLHWWVFTIGARDETVEVAVIPRKSLVTYITDRCSGFVPPWVASVTWRFRRLKPCGVSLFLLFDVDNHSMKGPTLTTWRRCRGYHLLVACWNAVFSIWPGGGNPHRRAFFDIICIKGNSKGWRGSWWGWWTRPTLQEYN